MSVVIWFGVAPLSHGKWFCNFGKRKGKREKKNLFCGRLWEVIKKSIVGVVKKSKNIHRFTISLCEALHCMLKYGVVWCGERKVPFPLGLLGWNEQGA